VAPKPVLTGVPEITMLYFFWKALTAASVRGPKYPVLESEESRPSLINTFWRDVTSVPFIPLYRGLASLTCPELDFSELVESVEGFFKPNSSFIFALVLGPIDP